MTKKENFKSNFFSYIAIFSLVSFALSQLIVNSILTPLGVKLQQLNTEKEHLLEENRNISEDLAKSGSIKVIEQLSEKKLKLAQDVEQTFIYIQDPSLVANK